MFFIDWEAPKAYLGYKVPVWRTIFLANEFNELQYEFRYLKPETTLFWFAFFMKGLGWEFLAKADPDMVKNVYSLEPVNLVLLFFISTFILLFIGAI